MLIDEQLTGVASTSVATAGYSSNDGLYSITGVFVATVNLERSLDGGTTWEVIASHTAVTDPLVNNTNIAAPAVGAKFRFTSPVFTSGAAVCKLLV